MSDLSNTLNAAVAELQTAATALSTDEAAVATATAAVATTQAQLKTDQAALDAVVGPFRDNLTAIEAACSALRAAIGTPPNIPA